MSTAKEQITALVQQLPDDSSYDEIVRELALHVMIGWSFRIKEIAQLASSLVGN